MINNDKYRQSYKQSMLDELKIGQLDKKLKKIIDDKNKNKNKKTILKPSDMSKYDIKNINKSIKEERLNSKLDKKQKDYFKYLDDITKLKNTNFNNVNLYDFFNLKNKFKKITYDKN